MRKKMILTAVLIGLSLLFGACAPKMAQSNEQIGAAPASSWDAPMEEEDRSVEMEESAMESYVGTNDESGGSAGVEGSTVERMVIYNADLSIAVEDPDAVMETIISMAQEAGGFVVYSNLYKTTTSSGVTLPRASLTVRVPAEGLDSILEEIRGLTPDPEEDVLSENVSGQDVTAEYTDLSSRLTNLEAAEAALVELMAEAKDPEDVLAIFDELTYYRGEIEVIKGRMQYLEESVSLSAISVEIIAKESLQPIEIAGWTPKGTVKDAVETLISTLQFLGDALIWFGIYCLPFLIPLGVGIYFLVKVLKKRRQKRKADKLARQAGAKADGDSESADA